MAKKSYIQKPALVTLLLAVMVASFVIILWSYPSDNSNNKSLPKQKVEVRDGVQVANVNILPKGSNLDASETSKDNTNKESKQNVKEKVQRLLDNGSVEAEGHVQFKIDHFRKLATQPLKFKVFDDFRHELTPEYLTTVNGAKVHLFLVHSGADIFYHFDSTYTNGYWNATANMPKTGTYYAYTVIDPVKGDLNVYRSNLVVRKESPKNSAYPALTKDLIAKDSPVSSKMSIKKFDAYFGFLYELTVNKHSVAASPYNETFAQMTLVKDGDPTFFKFLTADPASEENIGKLSFSMEKLKPGKYSALLEVKVNGKVRNFIYTFDI